MISDQLFKNVVKLVLKMFPPCVGAGITIKLCDPADLREFYGRSVCGDYGNGEVRISRETPRQQLVSTLAHELGHRAWELLPLATQKLARDLPYFQSVEEQAAEDFMLKAVGQKSLLFKQPTFQDLPVAARQWVNRAWEDLYGLSTPKSKRRRSHGNSIQIVR